MREKRKEYVVFSKKRVDYGQDAPSLLQKYLLAGGLSASVGELLISRLYRHTHRRSSLLERLGRGLLLVGGALLARGAVMIWSSRVGKVRAARSLLDSLALRGNETVLDVGCGRGLLLIGAAKRLPQGRAIGIDVWSQVDQRANSKQATLGNARIEGVIDRVEVLDGDMRALPLPDASIDVVVASKSIHNIPTREERLRALREIVRVLKPGGRAALMDIFCTQEFAEGLQVLGMQQVKVARLPSMAYPPLRIVTGWKSLGETITVRGVQGSDESHSPEQENGSPC